LFPFSSFCPFALVGFASLSLSLSPTNIWILDAQQGSLRMEVVEVEGVVEEEKGRPLAIVAGVKEIM
jgi:hypothetical protein